MRFSCSLLHGALNFLTCVFSGLLEICIWESLFFDGAESDISIPTIVWKFLPDCWDVFEDWINNSFIHISLKLWSVWDLLCFLLRCSKTIAAKGKSSIYMCIAKMLLDVMPRLFWDATRSVLLTTNKFAFVIFSSGMLNTFMWQLLG